ncbi:hypothetical protein KKC45_02665 [Patescibacteria group bacterium]|nr:hypothetical protein [Patescibacteria group bacterium]
MGNNLFIKETNQDDFKELNKEGILKMKTKVFNQKKISFIFIFILVLSIAILNTIGNELFLYWKLWWFDIIMHFLGGLWVGMSALWIYYFSGFFGNLRKDPPFIFLLSFLSVLAIGLGWEVFEFLIEIDFSNHYVSDTALDLIMDIVGGIIASIMFLRVK